MGYARNIRRRQQKEGSKHLNVLATLLGTFMTF